ncbi:hypothetical protein BJ912DRAFT_1057672 [Pholiota molesta]|nr:hypothetical protein BJ912DRAFT_1057672 [Pholiota molesta]
MNAIDAMRWCTATTFTRSLPLHPTPPIHTGPSRPALPPPGSCAAAPVHGAGFHCGLGVRTLPGSVHILLGPAVCRLRILLVGFAASACWFLPHSPSPFRPTFLYSVDLSNSTAFPTSHRGRPVVRSVSVPPKIRPSPFAFPAAAHSVRVRSGVSVFSAPSYFWPACARRPCTIYACSSPSAHSIPHTAPHHTV